jgi:hypothetical protein
MPLPVNPRAWTLSIPYKRYQHWLSSFNDRRTVIMRVVEMPEVVVAPLEPVEVFPSDLNIGTLSPERTARSKDLPRDRIGAHGIHSDHTLLLQ